MNIRTKNIKSVKSKKWAIVMNLILPVLALFYAPVLSDKAFAQQGRPVEATISKMRGGIKIISAGIEIAAQVTMKLSPGQTISTNNTGRLEISLSDRSSVTILPNSRIQLNDFRFVYSPRDLLTILSGKIKVKINHPIGVHNPYKLSTPAASIAVRGTEFIVKVEPSGNTSVFVIEGLVEVESTAKPSTKRLLSSGERAFIKISGNISINVTAGPGSGLSGIPKSRGFLDGTNREMTEAILIKSMGSIPIAYSAFSDPYYDSIENPSYSANINHLQGRITLLPSIGRRYVSTTSFITNSNNLGLHPLPLPPPTPDIPSKWDSNFNTMLTVYTPLLDSRLVIGTSATMSRMNLREYTDRRHTDLSVSENISNRFHLDNDFKLNATKFTLSAAMFLNQSKKTAIGVELDYLDGKSNYFSVLNSNSEKNDYSIDRIFNIKSYLKNYDATIGITHEFSANKKLGMYSRIGTGRSEDLYILKTSSKSPYKPCPDEQGSSSLSNKSYEAGIKWRSSLTKGIFYGVEGSYLYEDIRTTDPFSLKCNIQSLVKDFKNSAIEDSTPVIISDPSRRLRYGGGLGYKIKSFMLLSLDVTSTHINSARNVTGKAANALNYYSLTQGTKLKNDFLSYHAAMITNPWKQSIVSLSLYKTATHEQYSTRDNILLPTLGVGWNFKSGAQFQYYISMDFNTPSHSLLLNWNFDFKKEK